MKIRRNIKSTRSTNHKGKKDIEKEETSEKSKKITFIDVRLYMEMKKNALLFETLMKNYIF